MAKKFYVVWQGRETGIFTDWNTCKKHVDAFPGARYKSFVSKEEADQAFGRGRSTTKSSAQKVTPAQKQSQVKTYTAKEVDKLVVDVKIFTDGGCEPNPGKAGSGLALFRDNKLAELWYGLYSPKGTNNTAELNALHQGMLMAQNELAFGRSVVVFSDSKYSIQCITQWAVNWQKKGWKKPSGEIKNLELIQVMFALYEKLQNQLKICHVNGHVGVAGNELADRMSILAVESKHKTFSRYEKILDVNAILALRAG